jgi:small subunit ribosomal protein S4
MSRYTGPKVRLRRKVGRLNAVTRNRIELIRPGQHGRPAQGRQGRKNEETEYAQRLKEKQRLRFNYGVTERQLINYVKRSKRTVGKTGTVLLQFLEMRLDNIVYRLGLAPTIFSARQLVNHRHICVNGKRVSIPSYQCRPGDELSVWASREERGGSSGSSEKVERILSCIRASLGIRRRWIPQRVLRFDRRTLVGNVVQVISRDLVGLEVKELAVLEFYSRKI